MSLLLAARVMLRSSSHPVFIPFQSKRINCPSSKKPLNPRQMGRTGRPASFLPSWVLPIPPPQFNHSPSGTHTTVTAALLSSPGPGCSPPPTLVTYTGL